MGAKRNPSSEPWEGAAGSADLPSPASVAAIAGGPIDADPRMLLDLARMEMPFGRYQGRRLIDLPANEVSKPASAGFFVSGYCGGVPLACRASPTR